MDFSETIAASDLKVGPKKNKFGSGNPTLPNFFDET